MVSRRSSAESRPARASLRRTDWLLCLTLALTTVVLYERCLSNDFINFDDRTYITENGHLRSGVTLETVHWAFTTYYAGNWHPLTWLSHALDVQVFGLNPAGHHAVNVLLHALNAVLVFLLLRCATGAQMRSLLAAALFALHPLNVECVAWVAERKSLLCGFFFFLALGVYGWYTARPSLGRFMALILAFAFGLAAKPMVITLPFVLLLLDYWPLRRAAHWSSGTAVPARSAGQLILEKVPLLALSGASAAITVAAQRSSNAVASLGMVPLSARIENALWAYATYLTQALLPVGLAVFYPRSKVPVLEVLLSCVLLGSISLWAWHERRRRPYVIVGWCWYLGTLVPVIGLVQVGQQAMADRYAYIPLLGVFLALVWGVGDGLEGRTTFQRPVAIGVVVLLVILAGLTWYQTGWWNNSLALWTHTISVTRTNAVAEENLATGLMDDGRDEEAIKHWRNAISIQPDEPKAHIALGGLLQKQGELQPAIEQYRTALSLTHDGDDLRAVYTTLGILYRGTKDYSAAVESLRALLRLDPTNGSAMIALGNVTLLQKCGRMSRELAEHPSAQGFAQLGSLWEQAGDRDAAQRAYRSALDLQPNLSSAREGVDRLTESSVNKN